MVIWLDLPADLPWADASRDSESAVIPKHAALKWNFPSKLLSWVIARSPFEDLNEKTWLVACMCRALLILPVELHPKLPCTISHTTETPLAKQSHETMEQKKTKKIRNWLWCPAIKLHCNDMAQKLLLGLPTKRFNCESIASLKAIHGRDWLAMRSLCNWELWDRPEDLVPGLPAPRLNVFRVHPFLLKSP